MIVSHSKRFVFIKTRKTAGSSLQKALALACVPGDVVYSHPSLLPDWAEFPAELEGTNPHVGKDFMQERFPDEWRDYTKIASERHPLDKIVSLYWWEMRDEDEAVPFIDWFDALPDSALSDFDLYGDAAGNLIVDRVILFENVENDYRRCCEALGLKQVPLAREKGDIRPREDVALKHFTDAALARMQRVFHRECAAFGYRIPNHVSWWARFRDRLAGLFRTPTAT